MHTEDRQLPLKDRVAIVTGASRGAGRGIAVELGAAGATVYVTGRSTRRSPRRPTALLAQSGMAAMPGSIDETADEVTPPAVAASRSLRPTEHEVGELFARVQREQGRLDVLVNNAWGGHETFNGVFDAPFWEQPIEHWAMFDHGVRNHVVACRSRPDHRPPEARPDRDHDVLGPRSLPARATCSTTWPSRR